MKKASIKDVAKKAGVSTALVSYVLNNRHLDRINKDTAKQVREAAKILNYRPNKIAQSLKSNRTNTIALLIADIDNPLSSQIIKTVENKLSQQGYTTLIGISDNSPEKQDQLTELFLNHQADGFIIIPSENTEENIKKLINIGSPLVLIAQYFDDIETPVITTNNYGISYQAIDSLIKDGKNNIGILTYKTELTHLKERTKGYQNALSKNGLPDISKNIKYIDKSNPEQEVYQSITKFLLNDDMDKIDALFFTSPTLAFYGLKKLTELKVKIPEDITVLVFGESEILKAFNSSIIYIKQPVIQMAEKAVDYIMQMVENTKLKPKNRIYNSKLIVNEISQIEAY